MHTSKFHLALTTALALGMGAAGSAALLPHTAVGYPSGASISTGSNPVQSWAGTVSSSSTTIFTAPEDQDIVVTDVHLSCNYTCDTRFTMTRSDGTTIGSFQVSGGYGSSYDSLSIQQQFNSGLPVPAGQTLTIQTTHDTVSYTLSGYLAQP